MKKKSVKLERKLILNKNAITALDGVRVKGGDNTISRYNPPCGGCLPETGPFDHTCVNTLCIGITC